MKEYSDLQGLHVGTDGRIARKKAAGTKLGDLYPKRKEIEKAEITYIRAAELFLKQNNNEKVR